MRVSNTRIRPRRHCERRAAVNNTSHVRHQSRSCKQATTPASMSPCSTASARFVHTVATQAPPNLGTLLATSRSHLCNPVNP